MDKQLDTTIKKIIPISRAEQVEFLGNDVLVMHRKKKFHNGVDFFTVKVDLSTEIKTSILLGSSFRTNSDLVVDDNKERMMFTYRAENNHFSQALLYDQKGNKYIIPAFIRAEGFPDPNFASSSNQLLFTIQNAAVKEIKACDFVTATLTLQEDITAFIHNHPDLCIIKYLAHNKILCAKINEPNAYTYCVYDFTDNTFTNDFSLPIGSNNDVEFSLDGSFLVFNCHANETIKCQKISRAGDNCNCHKTPIVFLNNNKAIQIMAKEDNPKSNHQGRCGFAIHPNNRVIARLKDNMILYWHAYTGKQYEFKHTFNSAESDEELSYYFCTKCLSFSADGKQVAGAFPGACVVFDVPFEILHGITIKKEDLIWLWWVINQYQYCQQNKDIISLLINKIIEISKEIIT